MIAEKDSKKIDEMNNAVFTKEGNYLFKIIKAYDNNNGDFTLLFKVGKSPFKDDENVCKLMKQWYSATRNDYSRRDRYFFLKNFFTKEEISGEAKGKHVDVSRLVGKYITADVKIREYNGKQYYNLWAIKAISEEEGIIGLIEETFKVDAKRFLDSKKRVAPDPTAVEDITLAWEDSCSDIPF